MSRTGWCCCRSPQPCRPDAAGVVVFLIHRSPERLVAGVSFALLHAFKEMTCRGRVDSVDHIFSAARTGAFSVQRAAADCAGKSPAAVASHTPASS